MAKPMVLYGRPTWATSYPAPDLPHVVVVGAGSDAVKAALAAASNTAAPVIVIDSLTALADSIAKEGK